MLTTKDFIVLVKRALNNRKLLRHCVGFGCFTCLSSFETMPFIEFYDDDSGVCPLCGTATILPYDEDAGINESVLELIKEELERDKKTKSFCDLDEDDTEFVKVALGIEQYELPEEDLSELLTINNTL